MKDGELETWEQLPTEGQCYRCGSFTDVRQARNAAGEYGSEPKCAKCRAAADPLCAQPDLAKILDFWRCFHCDFHTTNREEAEAHFGEQDDAEEFKPICKWWSNMDEAERRAQFQDAIRDLKREQEENAKLSERIEQLEASNKKKPAPDPTCANADCGDVERLRDALGDVLDIIADEPLPEQPTPEWVKEKLQAMPLDDVVMAAVLATKNSILDKARLRALAAMQCTGKPLSAKPAETTWSGPYNFGRMDESHSAPAQPAETPYPADMQHWYRKDGRVFWSNCTLSGVEPVAAPDTHRALEDVLRVHDKEVVEAKSPSDVSDAAYKAVNAFRAALAAPSGVTKETV